MAKEGGFFSPNRKVSGKDKQLASSMSAGSYGGYVDAGESRGFVSPEQADKMIKNPEAYKMRPSETRYLRESMGLPRAQFFNPSGNEVGQIASATSDLSGLFASKQPLSPVGSDTYNKEVEGFIKGFKDDFNYRNKFDVDTGERKDKYGRPIPGERFGEEEMRRDYPFRRQFRYENFDGEKYTPGVPFGKKETDTKIAMGDNLGGYAAAIGGLGSMAIMGANAIKNTIQNIAPNFQKKIEQRVNPEQNKVSVGDQVGGFLNRMMGISPVAAGTLDANQQVSQVSERPKLNYVNPDATRMSVSEMADAFKPKNLFGYKDKFGRFDDPGSPLARDRAETIQRVAQNFSTPITADARTIGQIRADQEARMRENARLRNESFQRGERVQQKSADVTFGTGMLSNPAYRGLRENMSPEAQKKYDQSARDATEMARTDPSLGNVLTSGVNFLKGQINKITGQTPFTREKSLEKIGERQLRLANKEINRPTYQKEAYARKFLGITNDQLKAKNLQQIRANAFARNQAFQNERAQRALQIAANRRGENVGTGRDGGFGTGTSGQGMPSNPKGFSGYSRKSSPSTGTGTGTSPSRTRSRGGISKSTSRGQGGGSSSRSKGGVSKGGSKAKASGSRGQGGGTASRSKGGSFGGSRRSTNTSKSRRRCDIRTKIDITSLTNQNLINDDLATVAYFVQELREK